MPFSPRMYACISKKHMIVQPPFIETDVLNMGSLSWLQRIRTCMELKTSLRQNNVWHSLSTQTQGWRAWIHSFRHTHNTLSSLNTTSPFFIFRTSFQYDDLIDTLLKDAQLGHITPKVHLLSSLFFIALQKINAHDFLHTPYTFMIHGEHTCSPRPEKDRTLSQETTPFYILSCYYDGHILFQRRFLKLDLEEESQHSLQYLENFIRKKNLPEYTKPFPVFIFENEERAFQKGGDLKYMRIPYQIDNLIHLSLKHLKSATFTPPHRLRIPYRLTSMRQFVMWAMIPSLIGASLVYAGLPFMLDTQRIQALTQKIDHTHKQAPSFRSEIEKQLLFYMHNRHTPYFTTDFFKSVAPILAHTKPMVIQYQAPTTHEKYSLSIMVQRDHILPDKKDALQKALCALPHTYTTHITKNKVLFEVNVSQQHKDNACHI